MTVPQKLIPGPCGSEVYRAETENMNFACLRGRDDVAAAVHTLEEEMGWWQSCLCCWQDTKDKRLLLLRVDKGVFIYKLEVENSKIDAHVREVLANRLNK